MFKWAVIFFIIGWIDVSFKVYNDDRFSHFEKIAIQSCLGNSHRSSRTFLRLDLELVKRSR
jgi:hypothetical protein